MDLPHLYDEGGGVQGFAGLQSGTMIVKRVEALIDKK